MLGTPGRHPETAQACPAGSSFTRLTPSRTSLQAADNVIAIMENPHLTLSLDRVVANLHTAQATTYHLLSFHSESVKIPGARPGVLLDVFAANAPGRGGQLNRDAVINSLRVNG